MKQKLILILLTLTMQIFSNIVVIKCNNIVHDHDTIKNDTITVEIIATGSPVNEMELEKAIDDISYNIHFAEGGFDKLIFWISIMKIKEQIRTFKPGEQLDILIRYMNRWLNNVYGYLK